MEQVKITLALVIAILLQWTLRNIAEPFAYIDFPLIIIVYASLQGNAIRALLFGSVAGLTVDALSGGLLGANGFTKTLIAYVICEVARRVYLDNLLLRIPVLASACLVNSVVYYFMHRLFGQPPIASVVNTIAYSLIGTTIAGTIIFMLLEGAFVPIGIGGSTGRIRSGGGRRSTRREVFASRRQTRRRNPIRLGKRT